MTTWSYLPSSFLFAEVNGKGEVHSSKHCICFTGLRMADQLPQALVHDRVKECKVMPVHLRGQKYIQQLHSEKQEHDAAGSWSVYKIPSKNLLPSSQAALWWHVCSTWLDRVHFEADISPVFCKENTTFSSCILHCWKVADHVALGWSVWPKETDSKSLQVCPIQGTIHYLPMLRKQFNRASVFLPGRGE